MNYMFSYYFKKETQIGFGRAFFETTQEIKQEIIEELEKNIREENDFEAVVVIGLIKLDWSDK